MAIINGFIVVRKESHIDDKYWVFDNAEEALKVAEDVSNYWLKEYGDGEIDRTLYEGMLFNLDMDDSFSVTVLPQKINITSSDS